MENRGGWERWGEEKKGNEERVEDDRGGLQTSARRHLGNDNALTATANKSKRRMVNATGEGSEKHAHMDANKLTRELSGM